MRKVPFAGILQGEEERAAVMRVFDSKWHATGWECAKFEEEFAQYTGSRYCIATNSGSSANLLAMKVLDIPKKSKVLTGACGFPATVSPIIHCGCIPEFVDYSLPEHNIDVDIAKQVIDIKRPEAMIIAHTQGIPVDKGIIEYAKSKGIKVIEDCCEAVGASIDGESVGTFGTLGTFSFYPAHQINGFGGGGAIITDDESLAKEIVSMREWGKRVDFPFRGLHKTSLDIMIDDIPYDQHYTYDTLGYNFKLPEANCAYLRVQLKRLDGIMQKRKENWEYVRDNINKEDFIATEILPGHEPSYFSYVLTVNNNRGLRRDVFVKELEESGVGTRVFFAGNVTRHSPYREYFQEYRISDYLMRNSLFFGIWQGLDKQDFDYILETVEKTRRLA
jgi:CDP-6-deoxy-D-xylo-4-hexulose-3-dehydrase